MTPPQIKKYRLEFLAPFFWDSENRVFSIALSISLAVHILGIAVLSYTNMKHNRNIRKNMEIIYQAQRLKEQKTSQPPPDFKALKEHRVLMPKSLTTPDDILRRLTSDIDKATSKAGMPKVDVGKLDMPRKQSTSMPAIEGKRQISVPFIGAEKINNPRYLNYHDRIRNKIKSRAYLYIDNPEFEVGEVYVTFVVASSGEVTAVKIMDEKSRANEYLRAVGLRSVKESSPFPAFPDDLKYPELTFNVIISFENGE